MPELNALLPWLRSQHKALHSLHLKQIHSLLLTSPLPHRQRPPFVSLLLRAAAVSDFPYASLLLAHLQSPSIHLWDSLIGHFSSKTLDPRFSLVVYLTMLRNGVVPSGHTFPPLLKTISKVKNENPFQFHAHILKFGFGLDGFVRNSLISAYSNCGCVDGASRLFGESEDKDVVCWTAMIKGFVTNGWAVEALKCFVKMSKNEIIADEVTVASVLTAGGIAGDVWFGRCIHGLYIEAGRVSWDVYVGGALLDMYAKCGCCIEARKVFDEMPSRNVVAWSAMIAGYVQCNSFNDALLIFQDMLIENVEPNQQTLTSVLTACAQLGALYQGRWVHAFIDKNSVGLNSTLGTALIDMYAKCGCFHEALLVFENLPNKNVYTWTAMIMGLAMHGNAMGALDLFSWMLSNGILPNEVTFIGVLSACAHRGLVDEGRSLFRSMKEDYYLEPNVAHYGCMVDLLGRKGFLQEALILIESMPMEPTSGVWGALLASCMMHKNFELGDHVGTHLIKLQPNHSGRYALLANLYSESRKWDAAAHVRKLMKDKLVGKTPGFSLVEVNGELHEFITSDKSHSESSDLYGMLDNVRMEMKLNGCYV